MAPDFDLIIGRRGALQKRLASWTQRRSASGRWGRRGISRCFDVFIQDLTPFCVQPVGPVAAPAVVCRVIHRPRTHRIEFDIPLTQQKIDIGLHQRRLVTAVPQSAGTAISLVDVLHIAPAQRDHQRGNRLWRRRRKQQVHVVGHLHIGVQQATGCLECLTQPFAVGKIIVFGKKKASRLWPR